MQIQLQNISKRFGKTWIIKNFNQKFISGKSYAITGDNGSGKSTLLKIISGGLTPSLGGIIFSEGDEQIHWSDASLKINFAAPYVELIEQLTLEEHLQFHFKFKHIVSNESIESIIDSIEMQPHKSKLIKDFSSGMKQRLKLALALFTENPVILLDEPTSNLDVRWCNWYLEMVKSVRAEKLVIIASNVAQEYEFVDEVLSVG